MSSPETESSLDNDDAARPESSTLYQRAMQEWQKRSQQAGQDFDHLPAAEARQLLHQLQVHQIELEMQNEELRRAQLELEQSRASYTDLYDNAPVGYCTLSENGMIEQTNLTLATLLGLPRGQLLKKPFSYFIESDDQNIFYRLRKQLLTNTDADNEGLTQHQCELHLRANDGTVFWAHLTSSYEVDAENFLAIRLVVSDISKRKQSELRMAESEARFRTVVEMIPDAILVHHDGVLVFVNPAAVALFGAQTEGDLLGKSMLELIHPEDQHRAARQAQSALSQEQTSPKVELRIVTFAGTEVDVASQDSPILLEGAPAVLSTMHNISVRKKADKALRDNQHLLQTTLETLSQTERRFRQLADHTSDVFWVFDLDSNKVVYVNPAYERIWGNSVEDLLQNAHDWILAIVPEDRPSVEKTWQSVAETGNTFSVEYRILTKAGQQRWILDNGMPVRNDKGQIFRIVGIARDITQQKKVTQEYILARDRAEHLAHTRIQFLANMSHEIRTPMNGILGASELLLETNQDDDQYSLTTIIHESCRALITIINDVLDFSKMEAGRLTMERISFEPHAVVHSVYLLLKPGAITKGLEFKVSFLSEEKLDLIGDPLRMRQMLINLIGNALKFTEHGAVNIEVGSLKHSENRVLLRVTVRDTGIGIPEDKKHLIFDEFAQADDGISRQFGGTGLGLAISRKLARLMGGDISFSSEQGKGSCFVLEMVLEQSLPEPAQKPFPEILKRNYGKRVLLVEDNINNQKVMRRMLEKLGLEVDLAENGLLALEQLARQSYAVIFMDVQMPVMDGREATRLIRERRLSLAPIIAVTANVRSENQEACREAGVDAFLSKPIMMISLIEELDKWLIFPTG